MALSKDSLKQSLYSEILSVAKSNTKENESMESCVDRLAEAIASVVDSYVRSADVTVIADVGTINVAGSPTNQSNAVPITIEGNLS